MLHSRTTLSRGGCALTTLAILSVWFIGPDAAAAVGSVTGPDFPRALLGLASMVQLATGLWVILVVSLAQLTGPSTALRAMTPRILRSVLFAGTAGAIAITPAQADQGAPPSRDRAATSVTTHTLSGLPLPDRPLAFSPRLDTTVIVQPGDTLWAIARRSLPDGASDADVVRSCQRWFDANRAVIGSDPNLIQPTQHLRSPAKDHS